MMTLTRAPLVDHSEITPALLLRARSEFLEMPGLRLTPWQAARLLGVETAVSELVLVALVRDGFLWRNANGAYLRRSVR